VTFRILLTGSRRWDDRLAIVHGLCAALHDTPDLDTPAVLIHGACEFGGADTIADDIWTEWRAAFGTELFLPPERHRAADFTSPLERNKHMVTLGADVCVTFAYEWASGTGHCARHARKAGIPVIDCGISTRIEDRQVA
jgi:hypothetical protein